MKKKNSKKTAKPYSEDLKEYLRKIGEKQIPTKNKEFHKKVLQFRRKWKMPLGGFKNKIATNNWFKDPPREILKYPKIVEQTEREILHLGTAGKIVKELNPQIIEGLRPKKDIGSFPFGSFFTDLEVFMTENNIDHALTEILLNLLYYDNTKKVPYPKTIIGASERVIYTKSRKKVSHLVNVSFGPNTRQRDVLRVWDKYIAPLQKKLPGYQLQKTRIKNALPKKSS